VRPSAMWVHAAPFPYMRAHTGPPSHVRPLSLLPLVPLCCNTHARGVNSCKQVIMADESYYNIQTLDLLLQYSNEIFVIWYYVGCLSFECVQTASRMGLSLSNGGQPNVHSSSVCMNEWAWRGWDGPGSMFSHSGRVRAVEREAGGAAQSRVETREGGGAGRVQVKHIPGRPPSLRTDLARGTVEDGGAGLEDEDEDAKRWRPPPSRVGTGGERRSGAGNG
jgi:hypothetical protein